MNWYLVKIVFQVICGDGNHTAQFDEQLRLVAATGKNDACYKVQQLGHREEDSFFNFTEQRVQWKFINVMEVYRLSELIDGAELYSRIEEREHSGAYINMVHRKASGIINSCSHEVLQLV